MAHRLLVRIAIAAAMAVVVSSCSEHGRLLTAPTTTSSVPAATPGAAPGATALVLGQTTAQLLTAADPPCGLEGDHQPPEPCQQFAAAIVRPGILRVRLASPDELTLRVAHQTSWGKAVDISVRVEAGSTYGIAVGLHSGKGTQTFELTATLEPF